MSPLALSIISENQINKKIVFIGSTPMTCPPKKIVPTTKIEDMATNCSSIPQENKDNDILNMATSIKTSRKAYECEDVFPKNTIEEDHDVQLIRAKKRFTINQYHKNSPFALFKDEKDEQKRRSILQILKKKSIGSICTCTQECI